MAVYHKTNKTKQKRGKKTTDSKARMQIHVTEDICQQNVK